MARKKGHKTVEEIERAVERRLRREKPSPEEAKKWEKLMKRQAKEFERREKHLKALKPFKGPFHYVRGKPWGPKEVEAGIREVVEKSEKFEWLAGEIGLMKEELRRCDIDEALDTLLKVSRAVGTLRGGRRLREIVVETFMEEAKENDCFMEGV